MFSRADFGYYAFMAAFAGGALVMMLAAAWLAEHVWGGFILLSIFGFSGAIGAVGFMVWHALIDLWTWWRTRPPDLISRHPGPFRLAEAGIVVLVGVLMLVARILGDVGWVAIFMGVAWIVLELERQRNVKKEIEFQIRMAKKED